MKKLTSLVLVFLVMMTACLPYSFAADNGIILSAGVDNATGIVTITGNVPNGQNKQVTVKVINPQGAIDYLDQKVSGSDGSFSFTYVLDENVEGTYAVYVGGEGISTPKTTSFTYTLPNASPPPSQVVIDATAVVDSATRIVTISGTISSGQWNQVTVKVINPLGSIDYLDQKMSGENGAFVFTYTLDEDISGTYVVYVGGTGVTATKRIEFTYSAPEVTPVPSPTPSASPTPLPSPSASPVLSPTPSASPAPTPSPSPSVSPVLSPTPSASPASSPTPSASPVPTQSPTPSPGLKPVNGRIEIIPEVNNDGKATYNVGSDIINEAFSQVAAGSDGIRTIIIDVEPNEGIKGYGLQIPVEFMASGDSLRSIEIVTKEATVTLPGNMFRSNEVAGAESIEISMSVTDSSVIQDENVKKQIGHRPVVEISTLVDGKPVAWSNSNAPVTIELDYNPTAEELLDPEHIVVWYLDSNGQVHSVPNGRYDAARGKVVFSVTHFSRYAVAFHKKTFNDIAASWAKKEVEVMASKGIINGTSNTTYSPKVNITRADFIKLLVSTLELTAEFDSNFSDVKPTDYYYEYVGIARKLGITVGAGDNKFNPKQYITREDMMVLVERALRISGKLGAGSDTSILAGYGDTARIADYAKASIANLVKNGIIKGSGNLIKPKDHFTREEAAAVMYRIYNIVNQ